LTREDKKLVATLPIHFNVLFDKTKIYAYWQTLSLSVLAALVDSVLDMISQLVLSYNEKKSEVSHGRSCTIYLAM